VCPVKINIHDQLYKWRQVIVKEGYAPKGKAVGMKAMAKTLSSPGLFNSAGKFGRWVMKHIPFALNNGLNAWYKHRDMPKPPSRSFAQWYSRNKSGNKNI
jgi:L-lactate dehydrogenase complex protein LldF